MGFIMEFKLREDYEEIIPQKEKLQTVLNTLVQITDYILWINDDMLIDPDTFEKYSIIRDHLFDAFLGVTNAHYILETNLNKIIEVDVERIDEFFDLTLELEGGYSDNIYDNGGQTKYGITQNTLKLYNKNYNNSPINVSELTQDEARIIYRHLFYNLVPRLDSKEIHFNFIDICFNSGFGKYSICRKEVGPNPTIDMVYNWRENYFKNCSDSSHFLKGWLNRLTKIQAHFSNNKGLN